MAVARGTTPTFELTFTDAQLDLTQVENVYVTFQSGRNTLTKKGEDLAVEEKKISVWLTQAETLAFANRVMIQANWTMSGGMRAASDIIVYDMAEQLLQEVVE